MYQERTHPAFLTTLVVLVTFSNCFNEIKLMQVVTHGEVCFFLFYIHSYFWISTMQWHNSPKLAQFIFKLSDKAVMTKYCTMKGQKFDNLTIKLGVQYSMSSLKVNWTFSMTFQFQVLKALEIFNCRLAVPGKLD